MKLINLLTAKDAITRLAETRFSNFKTARTIARVKKAVDEEIDFYIEEEKKIVNAYAVKDSNGQPELLEGGRVKLATIEDKEKFESEIIALRDTEVDKIQKVSVKISDLRSTDNIPSPNDLLALENIVDFYE